MPESKIPIFINGRFVKSVPDYGADRLRLPFFGHKDVALKRIRLVFADSYSISLFAGEMDEESFKKYFDNDYARV